MYGGDGSDYLSGGNGEDALFGGADSDLLVGSEGNDVLSGGKGWDDLVGGGGVDTYLYSLGEDYDEIYDDGYTDDEILMGHGIQPGDLRFSRWNDDLGIYLAGGGSITVNLHFYSSRNSVEKLAFSNGAQIGLMDVQNGDGVLNGTSADSILTGGVGKDTLNGGDGNDWLNGMADGDKMAGNAGDDWYFVDSSRDSVTELGGEGTDAVFSAVSYSLGSNVENLALSGTASINGTGNSLNNVLTGNSAGNTLTGGAGNDWLDGGGGVDKMVGGTGDDTYVVDASTETVTERSNEGTDLVLSSATFTLSSNVENLTLTGQLAINGTGNALNNVLKGNSAVNSLGGGGGNDTLDGMGGADTLTGGAGNDTYVMGRSYGADTVVEKDTTAGNTDIAQFLSGIATDQIWFSKSANSLEVSVIGTDDKLVIKDWYLGSAYHVEQFKTADGKTLLDSQVANLVNAMASFAPPAAGQTALLQNYQDALGGVIAANWQ